MREMRSVVIGGHGVADVRPDHDHEDLRQRSHAVDVEVGDAERLGSPKRHVVAHHRGLDLDVRAGQLPCAGELHVRQVGRAPLEHRSRERERQRLVLREKLSRRGTRRDREGDRDRHET